MEYTPSPSRQVENQAIDESPLRVSRINAFHEAEESAS
jgi:hypothetical protein